MRYEDGRAFTNTADHTSKQNEDLAIRTQINVAVPQSQSKCKTVLLRLEPNFRISGTTHGPAAAAPAMLQDDNARSKSQPVPPLSRIFERSWPHCINAFIQIRNQRCLLFRGACVYDV